MKTIIRSDFWTKEYGRRILVMSLNRSEHDAIIKKYIKVFDELSVVDIVVKIAHKYRDLYGEWGLIFVRYVTSYFWVFPFIAAILLMIRFKRLNLFGLMQKSMRYQGYWRFLSFIYWFKRLNLRLYLML